MNIHRRHQLGPTRRRQTLGANERKLPEPKGVVAENGASELARHIFDLISTEGSLPLDVLAKRMGKSEDQIASAIILTPGWFTKMASGDIAIRKVSE